MSGALEGGDNRARLVRDDRVKPVVLADAHGRQRELPRPVAAIFEIDPGSTEPRFVACVPDELTAVEDVIGVAGTGEVAWVAGTLRGYGKNAEEITVGVTRVGVGDRAREAQARALPPGVEANAAAFDLVAAACSWRGRTAGVDVVDLTQKLRAGAGARCSISARRSDAILAYDPDRDRLFASDGRSTVVAVDLATSRRGSRRSPPTSSCPPRSLSTGSAAASTLDRE